MSVETEPYSTNEQTEGCKAAEVGDITVMDMSEMKAACSALPFCSPPLCPSEYLSG